MANMRSWLLDAGAQTCYATPDTIFIERHTVAFLPTGSGDAVGTSVLHCSLSKFQQSSITISGFEGAYGPDIDAISIPK